MSHLQAAFIAKSKAQMHQAPQRMQRGLRMREATRTVEVGVMGSKKNPKLRKRGWVGGMAWVWHDYDHMPSHLQFTLKK